MSNSVVTNKLKEYFDEMIVYKDLQKTNFFATLNQPSFLRDWLLKRNSDSMGNYDTAKIGNFVKKNIPKPEEWENIKGRLIDGERVKLLAKISIHVDVQTGEKMFELPDYRLQYKESCIDSSVWEKSRDAMTKANEVWGMIEIGYKEPEKRKDGRVILLQFQDFCPYTLDLDYYKDTRAQFSIEEWIDVLLGAIDYNADGYKNIDQKLAMIKRLLPFVEKRMNLIELAPKGTGKSYLFGRVSKFGWLSSGGSMTRAKLVYDNNLRQEGLIASHDFVALDEIQTIKFPDPEEIQGVLKGYLENGTAKVGNHEFNADCGLILLGNIPEDQMDVSKNLMQFLPAVFRESALLERFHGFIKGWDLPRMHDGLKSCGWGLNTEYFCSVLHLLRSDASYRCIVDELVESVDGDTRNNEAVKRIATGFLKLLFPNVRCASDIEPSDFEKYCFRPAYDMRKIILDQLAKLDKEYQHIHMPEYEIKVSA